eukprot:1966072-Pleurochrysis_carterae.AAC.1
MQQLTVRRSQVGDQPIIGVALSKEGIERLKSILSTLPGGRDIAEAKPTPAKAETSAGTSSTSN